LVQTESISRAFRAGLAATALALCISGGIGGIAAVVQPAVEGPAGGPWEPAPRYADLFAPAIYAASYQFFTTPTGLDQVLERIVQETATVRTPGGWTARALLPFDAFGQAGGYDRTTVARLYGARRARVARGPRQAGGAVVESWTLVSPYPDLALTRLEPGTLLIVLRLP
jgi:hypothetical protein